MNNNRNNSNNNNNRRRGRGNRNQSGGGSGGGNQGNRIDSRARGNAPQMLDKFKKLAQDAQHNDDRVQAEYYLQFADHYFRVIADNRTRLEEPRGARRDQDEFDGEDETESDDRNRYDSRDFGRDGNRDAGRDVEREPNRDAQREPARDTGRDSGRDPGREASRDRPQRENNRNDRPIRPRHERPADGEATEGPAFETDDNPFVRDTRSDQDARPERAPERPNGAKRRTPRPRRADSEDTGARTGIDAAVLPPSFSASDVVDTKGDIGDETDGEAAIAAPRRRRKATDGGTLSAVG